MVLSLFIQMKKKANRFLQTKSYLIKQTQVIQMREGNTHQNNTRQQMKKRNLYTKQMREIMTNTVMMDLHSN